MEKCIKKYIILKNYSIKNIYYFVDPHHLITVGLSGSLEVVAVVVAVAVVVVVSSSSIIKKSRGSFVITSPSPYNL